MIGDLPGNKLADTLGSTMTIDANAAGWGWNLTPGVNTGTKIDLMSVLLHEIGHVLGYEHTSDGLMAEAIEPGTQLWTSAVGHVTSAVQPVTDMVGPSAHAADLFAGGIARVADPAVRTWPLRSTFDRRERPTARSGRGGSRWCRRSWLRSGS